MSKTKIEWADVTWSPITGCTPISAGCAHCFAKRMSKRLAGRHGYPEAPHNFDVTWHADKLDRPLRWRKPRRIFICSMSDLFHARVKLEWQLSVFRVVEQCLQHTFLILTKRIDQVQMLHECTGWEPPENVWLGVTAENQAMADKRIPILLSIPAAVHFVSIEPLLEPIIVQGGNVPSDPAGPWPDDPLHSREYLRGICGDRRIDWVIVGAESGPGARPMDLAWARSVRDQCLAAGVAFFFKRDSDGNRELDGKLWEEFPG